MCTKNMLMLKKKKDRPIAFRDKKWSIDIYFVENGATVNSSSIANQPVYLSLSLSRSLLLLLFIYIYIYIYITLSSRLGV